MAERRTRDPNLDLIRAVAGWLVVSVHFFLNICYYYEPLQGGWMLLMSVLRMACMTCVPLFLMLTGYLCCEKRLTPRYFLGIVRVLLTYLLASVVCLAFRRFWLGEPVGIRSGIRMVLNFTGVATGWYIGMYIWLFLAIPFLNMLWRRLQRERNRRWLVIVLAVLTVLPGLTSLWHVYRLRGLTGLYPLCYYFIGAYLRTYQPKPKWWAALLGLMGSVTLGGVVIFWKDHGGMMRNSDFTEWAGPTVLVSACCLFLLLRQVPCGRWPGWVNWMVRKGAELSLGIYLVSWCFDHIYHRMLWPIEPTVVGRLKWYFLLAPAVYLSSALVAQLIEWARKGVTWCINKIIPKANLR